MPPPYMYHRVRLTVVAKSVNELYLVSVDIDQVGGAGFGACFVRTIQPAVFKFSPQELRYTFRGECLKDMGNVRINLSFFNYAAHVTQQVLGGIKSVCSTGSGRDKKRVFNSRTPYGDRLQDANLLRFLTLRDRHKTLSDIAFILSDLTQSYVVFNRFVVLVLVLLLVDFDRSIRCVSLLWQHCLGYAAILVASAFLDLMISMVAMRGGILDVEARAPMKYLIYIRLGVQKPLFCVSQFVVVLYLVSHAYVCHGLWLRHTYTYKTKWFPKCTDTGELQFLESLPTRLSEFHFCDYSNRFFLFECSLKLRACARSPQGERTTPYSYKVDECVLLKVYKGKLHLPPCDVLLERASDLSLDGFGIHQKSYLGVSDIKTMQHQGHITNCFRRRTIQKQKIPSENHCSHTLVQCTNSTPEVVVVLRMLRFLNDLVHQLATNSLSVWLGFTPNTCTLSVMHLEVLEYLGNEESSAVVPMFDFTGSLQTDADSRFQDSVSY
ncbi:hypothetical protein J6590_069652 [Homalodisca vitripennis]|nr:hypothetical protein J6590_069652 [Homalodisca vitripennis]